MAIQSSPSQLRTVLIGTSLEDESDQVVRWGLAVARAAGARVLLVHAAPIEPRVAGLESGWGDDFIAELIASYGEKLQQQIERLGIDESDLAGAEVLTGSPHRVLVDAAQKAGAELIVVGATMSGPLAAELLGSTAERVMRQALSPVLVVRGEVRVPPRRVLAPVDLSPLSAEAFRRGLNLLRQLAKEEIEVRAVHALSFLDTLAFQRQEPGEAGQQRAERAAAEALQRFVEENRPQGSLKVDTAVLSGEAWFEILEEFRKNPPDLVILGTHGRGGLDRLMLGSVAATVARKAPCSVLLIPPAAAAG
jgi:nucleotide-binding universal stress UspA family protein